MGLSDEARERRWRLRMACAMARVPQIRLAAHLGVTVRALDRWALRGDMPQHAHNHLSSASIAAAIGRLGDAPCPPEALRAGAPWRPGWIVEP